MQLDPNATPKDMEKQVKWLRRDLRKVHRELTPWVIVSSQPNEALEKSAF